MGYKGFSRWAYRGGRPHIPVDKDAPLGEFDKVAAGIPVFRVRAAA